MGARRPSRSKTKIVVPSSLREVAASRAMLWAVRDELVERMSASEARWDARFVTLESRFDELRHDLRADVARITVLVEEQNARNAIVLEAIRGMIDRQDRVELRLDGVEGTVSSLATSR